MTEKQKSNSNVNRQSSMSAEKQIETFARRLLPEIKRFFADEDIRNEFEEWQRRRKNEKAK